MPIHRCAARLEGLADPGGIIVAEHVRTYVRNKVDFDFEDLGSHKLKNIDERIRAFKVVFAMPSAGMELSRTRFPWTQNWLNRSVQGGPEQDRQF